MHFLQDINSDLSVLIVCNKTGDGTIKGDIKKKLYRRTSLKPTATRHLCTPRPKTAVTADTRIEIVHILIRIYTDR